jgi:transcriptional regulator with XRE-family HTH domain
MKNRSGAPRAALRRAPHGPTLGERELEADVELTGALCRAGRALVQWPREQLAEASGVSKKAIRDFETGGADPGKKGRAALRHALETAGAVFLDEDDMGAGVRLRFTRRDVKQINRLEGEGGVVGDDDV